MNRRRFRPDAGSWARLGRDTVAALVVGLAALSFYVSAAGLLFQGALAPHLPAAIGAALLGSALLSLAAAWRGSLPLASAGLVPSTVPVLASLTAGIAASASPATVLPTAVVGLALTAALLGLTWWAMGRWRWGGLVRYVPFPVIGGFMASTGWLIGTGGLGVATGQPFGAATLQAWLGGAADARLAAGVGLGLLFWQAGRRFPHPLVLPALLLAAGLALHAALAAAGLDLVAARQAGWLQAPFAEATPVWPLQPSLWPQVDAAVLLQQAGWMAAFVIVATLTLLLTSSSLETAWDTPVDINRDLRAMGQGSLVAALVGGLAGGLSLSRSVLNRSAGAQGRASGVLLALLCLLMLLWGGPAIARVPLPLLGGLLLAQGLEMLAAWVWDSRARLSRRDRATVLAMVVVTAVVGFLPAVCLGVLACCVDLAVSQAQFPPVRRALTRAAWLSSVERPPAQAEWLVQQGAGLQLVELQGVLFFGSVTRLSQQVEALLAAPAAPRCLLFDFQHVRLLDSSAAQALARLFKAARRAGLTVELSGLQGGLQAQLQAAGALALAAPRPHASLDAAVAAWDEALLAAQPGAPAVEAALAQQLGPALAARLLPAFETVTLAPGALLFERGEASDALYLVAQGRLAVVVPGADGAGEVTLRTVMAGSTLGEMGLFRGRPRSATVRALEATTLLRLGAARLAALEADDPPLAAALYRLFVLQLASRLDQLTVQAHLLSR